MFDRYLDPGTSRRKRWRTGVTVSAAAHGAVGLGILVATFWNIDKLQPLPSTVVQVGISNGGMPTPDPGGAPPPLKRPHAAKTPTPHKPKPNETVQPIPTNVADDPADSDDSDDGDDDGSTDGIAGSHGKVPGGPIGIGPGIGDCIGECTINKTTFKPPVPETKPPKDPEVVLATFIEGYRVSGDPQIAPPQAVQLQMVRAGQDHTRASVKMCLDAGGSVDSLKLVASSGYDEYDRLLLSEMRGWQYKPYLVNGAPIAVCTAVTFIFKLN